MNFVVGITGGIGSGKSAVTAHLENLGIDVVDADLAARVVVEPGQPALEAIAEHFGTHILLQDGHLDRAALRKIVFEDPQARTWLESVTHPAIRQEIESQLQSATSPYVVLSSPLLSRRNSTVLSIMWSLSMSLKSCKLRAQRCVTVTVSSWYKKSWRPNYQELNASVVPMRSSITAALSLT